MKKLTVILGIIGVAAVGANITGCKLTASIAAKSGAQIWGENCIRCHNTPSPDTFSDVEWDVAMLHMQIRANLTKDEATKVVEFMKSAN